MKRPSNNAFHKLPVLDGLELLDAHRHRSAFPYHSHPSFNITLVSEQTFSNRLADAFFQAPVGTIMITHPGEVHATFCDSTMGSSFFTFYISPDVINGLQQQPAYFPDRVITDRTLFRDFYQIATGFTDPLFPVEVKMMAVLKKLVFGYSIFYSESRGRNPLFQTYLEETSMEKFSLDRAARHFGLDKFKFLRLFKQETGLTPNNYIILKRIEKSKRLLQTGEDLLGIALETGFYDATHFCRHFKRMTGVTPQAYRLA